MLHGVRRTCSWSLHSAGRCKLWLQESPLAPIALISTAAILWRQFYLNENVEFLQLQPSPLIAAQASPSNSVNTGRRDLYENRGIGCQQS